MSMSYNGWIEKMHENVSKGKKLIKITPELRKEKETEIQIQMSALIMEQNIVVTEEGESII